MKRLLTGAALLLALAAAGCASDAADDGIATAGSASPSGSSGSGLDDRERARKFAQCMREHGVEMPDPGEGADEGGVRFRFDEKTDRGKAEAAMQACRQYAPNGGEPPKLSPEQVEQARKFSRCMREHGVPNFPDPDANGLLKMTPDSGVNPRDPKFKTANDACEKLAPRPRGPRQTAGE